jgi:hypothetical protein
MSFAESLVTVPMLLNDPVNPPVAAPWVITGDHRRHCVLGEEERAVVHQRIVVIEAAVIGRLILFIVVVFKAGLDLLLMDDNEPVPVLARLLVEEAGGVANFVDDLRSEVGGIRIEP